MSHPVYIVLFSILHVDCLHLLHDSELHCSLYLLSGRVYNVTHYLDFHPGGDAELMRGVGQDGTSLFNQVGSAIVKAICTKTFYENTIKQAVRQRCRNGWGLV
jgi:cytochrome b involved in lipid metabolism